FVAADKGAFTFTVILPTTGAVVVTAKDSALAGVGQLTVVSAGTAVTTLPADTVGIAYNQTIPGSAGTGPYTLTVTNIRNPIPGLNVPSNGIDSITINGTPTTSGTMVFDVTTTDSLNNTSVATYAINVNPSISLLPAILPVDTVNVPYSKTIAPIGGT